MQTKYRNRTEVEQTQQFTDEEKRTNQFTWSVTESLDVGVEISATVGLPDVASTEEKLKVDMSVSSTQSQTKTEEKTWAVDVPVICAPMTETTAAVYLVNQTCDLNLEQRFKMAQAFKIESYNGSGGRWFQFGSLASIIRRLQVAGKIDILKGYSLTSNNEVMVTVKRHVSGTIGLNTYTDVESKPLDGNGNVVEGSNFVSKYTDYRVKD